MKVKQHGGAGVKSYVVDQFEAKDLGAPFKVILHKAVRIQASEETGEIVKYSIPDLDGLLRTAVITRILKGRKLSGPDIRFIRKVIGVKQKDMADRIEMSHEHLSRCEAGMLVMSPTSEKLLRIFALKTAIKLHKIKNCDAKTKLEDSLDKLFDGLKPVAAHDINDVLVLHFHRTGASSTGGNGDDTDGHWDDDQPAEAA